MPGTAMRMGQVLGFVAAISRIARLPGECEYASTIL
jgi:hypothetical protein